VRYGWQVVAIAARFKADGADFGGALSSNGFDLRCGRSSRGSPKVTAMKTHLGPVAAAVLCSLIAGLAPAHAQTPAPTPAPAAVTAADKPTVSPGKPKSTRSERAAAQAGRRKQMMERDAILRKKRAACLQERQEKKIPIFDRPRFIRECMARP
jgi:hypothetical protein